MTKIIMKIWSSKICKNILQTEVLITRILIYIQHTIICKTNQIPEFYVNGTQVKILLKNICKQEHKT